MSMDATYHWMIRHVLVQKLLHHIGSKLFVQIPIVKELKMMENRPVRCGNSQAKSSLPAHWLATVSQISRRIENPARVRKSWIIH
jgi:hypothetical protein